MTIIIAGLHEINKHQNFIFNIKSKDLSIIDLEIKDFKSEKDYISEIGKFSLDNDFVLISLDENVLKKLVRIDNNNIKARLLVFEKDHNLELREKLTGWYQLKIKKDRELFNTIKFKV